MESVNRSSEKTDFLILYFWVPYLCVRIVDIDLPVLLVPWSSMASEDLAMLVNGGMVVITEILQWNLGSNISFAIYYVLVSQDSVT